MLLFVFILVASVQRQAPILVLLVMQNSFLCQLSKDYQHVICQTRFVY